MIDVEAVRAVARLSRILERECGELSMAHYRVLAAVADGDERASRVARRLALGKPAISASVEALCRRGLLTREDVAGDQRAITLRITPSGARALRVAEDAMRERLDAVLAHTKRPAETSAALCRLSAGIEAYASARVTV
ncbi:MAG TPA: MarR family winged helix-turn-helix transcriptional regulator [Jatrophihabitans sp.]